MPDISMCSGKDCMSRNKCYRYRAIPNGDRQCWVNKDITFGPCVLFLPIHGDPHSPRLSPPDWQETR